MKFSKKWDPPSASEVQRKLNVLTERIRTLRRLKPVKRLARVSSKFFTCSRGNGGVFVPSNLRGLRYLDLYENCQYIDFDKTDVIKLRDDELLFNDPLLDYPVVKNEFHVSVHQKMEKSLYRISKFRLNFESACIRIEHLIRQWDVRAFVNLAHFVLDVHFELLTELSEFCIDIMMLHDYKKSDLVVRFFKAVCTECEARSEIFIAKLSEDKIRFFVWHLQRTADFYTYVKELWYETQDPISVSILEGNTEELKKFLSLNYPSILHPVALHAKNVWPRRKHPEVSFRSFYSLEYYSHFTESLLCLVNSYRRQTRPSDFKKAFQILWRSIPMPYLPLSDMRESCNYEKFDDRIWAMVADLFAEDFPYEFKPRSLLHLSACAVREVCPWPEQIAVLPVPESAKDYLLLAETAKTSSSTGAPQVSCMDVDCDSLWTTFEEA